MAKSYMSDKEYHNWQYDDAKHTKKKISSWIIELIYGTNRGGVILIWQKGASTLHHIWTPSINNDYMLFQEVHFMDWRNAKEEFSQLKTVEDIMNLIERNQ